MKKAGDGNRTHVSSLEGWCSTIELHPHEIYCLKCPEPESNQRHKDFQSFALPTELSGHVAFTTKYILHELPLFVKKNNKLDVQSERNYLCNKIGARDEANFFIYRGKVGCRIEKDVKNG